MKIIERNLQEIGKSLLVTLPKSWTKPLNLKKGSVVKIMVSEKGHLIIAPDIHAEKARKQAVITYDRHFPRHFFREYFLGSEMITILFQSRMDEDEKQRVYSFLRRFMNVQIMEESREKLALKAFRIEELSIQDCLTRMHFLTLSMLEEVIHEKEMVKLREIEETLTKFYYMLVMQVRRFIEEGKYTDVNEISLLRAMDCRMVAEKIERIADRICEMDTIEDLRMIDMIAAFKEYYAHAFSAFINDKYLKSVGTWDDHTALRTRLACLLTESKKQKDMALFGQALLCLDIIEYAKDISMLVR